jgi:hypothetical protein
LNIVEVYRELGVSTARSTPLSFGRTLLVTHVDAIADHAVVAGELVERPTGPVLFTSS